MDNLSFLGHLHHLAVYLLQIQEPEQIAKQEVKAYITHNTEFKQLILKQKIRGINKQTDFIFDILTNKRTLGGSL